MAVAALDLDDLVDQFPAAAVEPAHHGGALRFEARTALCCFAVESLEVTHILTVVSCHVRRHLQNTIPNVYEFYNGLFGIADALPRAPGAALCGRGHGRARIRGRYDFSGWSLIRSAGLMAEHRCSEGRNCR